MVPSPKVQIQNVGDPVERSVNWTTSGAVPDVGAIDQSATSGAGSEGVTVTVVVDGGGAAVVVGGVEGVVRLFGAAVEPEVLALEGVPAGGGVRRGAVVVRTAGLRGVGVGGIVGCGETGRSLIGLPKERFLNRDGVATIPSSSTTITMTAPQTTSARSG
jgi:hypothetical protein